jgi:hypothetical protein
VGDYKVEISASTRGLQPMEVAQYFVGIIDGVRYSGNGTSIVVNDLEYQVANVFEIVAASSDSDDDEAEDDDTKTVIHPDLDDNSDLIKDEKDILGHKLKGY